MAQMDLYIMFNDFLNCIELKHKGNRELFINCSIRKYNDFKKPLFINIEEKRKGAPILRFIKDAGRYKAYTDLFENKK